MPDFIQRLPYKEACPQESSLQGKSDKKALRKPPAIFPPFNPASAIIEKDPLFSGTLTMTMTRVLIAGGGFGGLETAFSLNGLPGRPFEITLLDKNPYHSFLPSIHLILSGKIGPEAIRIPLKTVLGAAGMRFVHDAVFALDAEKRAVTVASGAEIGYDYLVLSCGAESAFFNIPGIAEFSHRFRSPEDAEEIRKSLTAFLHGSRKSRRIIIAGAGTEGIEASGEIVDLIQAEGLEDDLTSGRISVELIEGKSRLLPNLPAEAQARAEEYLSRRGVRLTPGDPIAEAGRDSVALRSGQIRDSSFLIWSGGIQPSGLIRNLPFDKDPWGWLKVNDYLHVPDQDRIFAVGDAVSIYTEDGPVGPQRLASHALDQARTAAINIAARTGNGRQIRYEPKKKPQLISLGSAMGIFSTEERVYSGPWVVALKKAIERNHLMTYLTKPVSSRLQSRIPGAALWQRIRTKLPV